MHTDKTILTVEDFVKRQIPANVALKLICEQDAPSHFCTPNGVKIPLTDYNLMIIDVSQELHYQLFSCRLPRIYPAKVVREFFNTMIDLIENNQK